MNPIDQEVARKIFNLNDSSSKILPYSTDLRAAYQIIKHFQNDGWFFGVKSIHHSDGSLSYKTKFIQSKQVVEYMADTLPLSICHAGLLLINEQWIEHSSNINDNETNILPKKQHNILIDDTDLNRLLLNSLKTNKMKLSTDEMSLLEILEKSMSHDILNLSDIGFVLTETVNDIMNIIELYKLSSENQNEKKDS